MMMIEPGSPSFLYRCDVCLITAQGDSLDYPPPGFATMAVRCHGGMGMAVHVCCHCLPAAADNIADGRLPTGEVLIAKAPPRSEP